MLDYRDQVAEALETVCDNVRMTKPDGDIELPLICYAQTGNNPVNMLYDRLRWRIAVYCNTFEELVQLTDKVDGIMSGRFGFTRTNRTGDDSARIGTDLYLFRIDYSGIVNRETGGVIRYST